ncbi:MAG: preprotein translocase subunit SecE [Phycisphaeraceae bacterium]|nr:preprotein translocase subunit SecE [Phycisphaeraceae bacterium]
MALQVYKSGQGYWTRMMTAIAVMTFTLGFAVWFNDKLLFKFMDNEKNEMYWQAGIIAVTAVAVGALLWWLLNKPKIADFMIATENEMKKVNWPTKQAVIGLTWIVIAGTLMIAAILFVADFGFTNVATWIGILESAETP